MQRAYPLSSAGSLVRSNSLEYQICTSSIPFYTPVTGMTRPIAGDMGPCCSLLGRIYQNIIYIKKFLCLALPCAQGKKIRLIKAKCHQSNNRRGEDFWLFWPHPSKFDGVGSQLGLVRVSPVVLISCYQWHGHTDSSIGGNWVETPSPKHPTPTSPCLHSPTWTYFFFRLIAINNISFEVPFVPQ